MNLNFLLTPFYGRCAYLGTEKYDAALDQIEHLLSIPSWLTVPLLRVDPRYDPLRENTRFQALLAKYDKQ